MSDIQSIKHRATSIKNIGKITKSLETVSALQLKSAEKRISNTREYFESLLTIARKLAATQGNVEMSSLFYSPKNVHKIAVVLITTDRGLVGGQNLSLFSTLKDFFEKQHIEKPDFFVFGSRGISFAEQAGSTVKQWSLFNKDQTSKEAAELIVSCFECAKYERVYIVYNQFLAMQNIQTVITQFLPLHLREQSGLSKEIIEPDLQSVIHNVVEMYLLFVLKHALIEAETSEHAARMIAMKSASENASELSKDLTRQYNTARQEGITEEILEGAFHHG